MAIEGNVLTPAAEYTLTHKQVRELTSFERWNGSAYAALPSFESYLLKIEKAFSLAELEVIYNGDSIVSALSPYDKARFNIGMIGNDNVAWWNTDAKFVGYVDSLIYDEVSQETIVRCLDKLKLLVDGMNFEGFYGAEFAWTTNMMPLVNTHNDQTFTFLPPTTTIYDPTQVIVYGLRLYKSNSKPAEFVPLDIDFISPDAPASVRLESVMITDVTQDVYFAKDLDGYALAWAIYPQVIGVGTGNAGYILKDLAVRNGFLESEVDITGLENANINKIEFTAKEYANAFECAQKVLELVNIPNFVLRCFGEKLIGRVVTQGTTEDYTLYLPTKQDKEYSLKDVYTQVVTYGRHFSTDLECLNEFGHCTIEAVFDAAAAPITQYCYVQKNGTEFDPEDIGLTKPVEAILPYMDREFAAYGFKFPWHTLNETQIQAVLGYNSYIEIDLGTHEDIGFIRMLTPINVPNAGGVIENFKSALFYQDAFDRWQPLNVNTILINNTPGQWFVITEEDMATLPKIRKFRIYFKKVLWFTWVANWACWRFEIYAPSLIVGKATLQQNSIPPSGSGWVDHGTYWSKANILDPSETFIAANRTYIPATLLSTPKAFKTEEYPNITSQQAANDLAIKILVNEVSKKFHSFTVEVLYSPHFDLFQTIKLFIAGEEMNAMIIGITFGKKGIAPTVILELMNYEDNT